MKSSSLPEVLGEAAETDGGEEVDCEPGAHGVVPRHDALEGLGQGRVAQPLVQLGYPHVLGQLLEEDLDENPGAGGGLLLVEPDDGDDLPRHGVGVQEVPEQLPHVAQLPDLQPVHSVVGRGEGVLRMTSSISITDYFSQHLIIILYYKKKNKFGHVLVAVQLIHRLKQADISYTTMARLFFFPLLCYVVLF